MPGGSLFNIIFTHILEDLAYLRNLSSLWLHFISCQWMAEQGQRRVANTEKFHGRKKWYLWKTMIAYVQKGFDAQKKVVAFPTGTCRLCRQGRQCLP